jgi:hypothetical protein
LKSVKEGLGHEVLHLFLEIARSGDSPPSRFRFMFIEHWNSKKIFRASVTTVNHFLFNKWDLKRVSGSNLCRHEQRTQSWGILTWDRIFADSMEALCVSKDFFGYHRHWRLASTPCSPFFLRSHNFFFTVLLHLNNFSDSYFNRPFPSAPLWGWAVFDNSNICLMIIKGLNRRVSSEWGGTELMELDVIPCSPKRRIRNRRWRTMEGQSNKWIKKNQRLRWSYSCYLSKGRFIAGSLNEKPNLCGLLLLRGFLNWKFIACALLFLGVKF